MKVNRCYNHFKKRKTNLNCSTDKSINKILHTDCGVRIMNLLERGCIVLNFVLKLIYVNNFSNESIITYYLITDMLRTPNSCTVKQYLQIP